jgi:hypothetical protein
MYLEELEPVPEELECLCEALALSDAQAWWEAALQLGVVGAMGKAKPDLKEPLRQRARKLGSSEPAMHELVAEETGGSEGRLSS